LGLLWDYLKFIGRFDLIWLPAPGLVEILATVTGLVLLLLPLRFPLKSLGVLLLLGSFIPKFNQIDKGVAHITVLDVGQGLSVLVQTQNHKLLFDTGAKYPESEGLFKMAVLPVLIDNNIASLDRFIISHADNDHSGGYQDAIESMRIRDILSSSPDKFAASRACRPQSWRWDQVQFDILHPGVEGKFKGNNSSCVVKITTSGASFLLLSDLESRGEKALMENADIRADAFLVGHHGSKTSSTPELLAKLKAKYAVISAGFYNRYHHPHPSVIKMLKHFDLQIFNTAKSGALEIIAGDGINIREYRREYGKPWHIYPAD
jgi:competence protein ComEC